MHRRRLFRAALLGVVCGLALSGLVAAQDTQPADPDFDPRQFLEGEPEEAAAPSAEESRTLTLLDPSDEVQGEISSLIEALGDAVQVKHAFFRGKLWLSGSSQAVAQLEAMLAEAGFVPERYTCETVPLYFLRDAQALQTVLADLRAQGSAFGEVTVTTGGEASGRPALVLYGPRTQVEDCRRVINAIDLPSPEVRLGIWAFQFSGDGTRKAGERAREAHGFVDATGILVRGYLQQLRNCALDEQRRNAEGERMTLAMDTDALSEELGQKFNITMDISQTEGPRVLPIPSARGIHPLGLTETLATLTLAQPRGKSLRATIEANLRPLIARWLTQQDPQSIDTWRRMLEGAGDTPTRRSALAALASADAGDEERERLAEEAAGELMPRELLTALEADAYGDAAQEALSGFLVDWERAAGKWQALPPDRIRRRAADARVVLQSLERALATDVSRLFLDPLVEQLQTIAGRGAGGGLGAAGTTSVTVLSGKSASVTGATESYFDVSRPPTLDAATLREADRLTNALGTALPRAPARPAPVVVVRVVLNVPADAAADQTAATWVKDLTEMVPGLRVRRLQGDPTALMLTGPQSDVDAAMAILQAAGAVESTQASGSRTVIPAPRQPSAALSAIGGSLGGLPAERLAALGLALGSQPSVWSALNSGASLDVTPHVLPGGASAELELTFTINHDDATPDPDEGRQAVPPLSRVAKHEAETTVYVDSLDLFRLSSLSLQTSRPRPDAVVPVLGQLPFVGRLFRLPRKAASVHHESMLLVVSTILPTGMDLGETFDFEVVKE